MLDNKEKLHATNHYMYYPKDEKNIPSYLAYGFRPTFLLLAPYLVISMILWGLVWSGVIYLPFMNDILTWHIYEMLFGILTAGTMAFLTTGLPELYPGMIPFVGKKLIYILALWILGRVSFWLIDITGIYIAAFFNLSMYIWILWFAKDVILDPLQRHASIAYVLILLFFLECWYFLCTLGYLQTNPLAILKLSIGAIVALILLVLRRVNMEAVNELLEDKKIDDVYISHPYLTNLALFCIAIYTIGEFFYPLNPALGWLGIATGAAILGIISDYFLKESFIFFQPYIIYLSLIYIFFSLGYFFIGADILFFKGMNINHFRHFITIGGISLSYILIMIIISWIHTGRKLTSNFYTHLIVFFMSVAAILRGIIPFYMENMMSFYFISTIFWSLSFLLYIKQFFYFLLSPRADGIDG
jgi:uncharacterized protein involved in response to NO